MLTKLFWYVILQISHHEELEALIVNRLREKGKGKDVNRLTDGHVYTNTTTDGQKRKCDGVSSFS